MVGLRHPAVGRVEPAPADLGEVDLDPRVRGLALRAVGRLGARVDVAAHVPRRDAEQPREAEKQVGEVLADAEALRVDLERRRVQPGAPLPVRVLLEHRRVEVEQRVEQVVVVALDEAHRVLAKLGQLAVGQLGGQQVGLEHVALPGHPHERDGRARVQRQERRVGHRDARGRLDAELGVGRVEQHAAHAVAEHVVVLGALAVDRERDAVLEHGLRAIVEGKEPQHVGAALDRARVAVHRAVRDRVGARQRCLGAARGGRRRARDLGAAVGARPRARAHRALAQHDQLTRREALPVGGLVARQRLGRHDDALAALDAAGGEIDREVGVAERDVPVGRRDVPEVRAAVARLVGVHAEVAPVGEHRRHRAAEVELGEPRPHDGRVGLAQAAPAPRREAREKLAEDALGVGRADGLEGGVGREVEALAQAAAMGEEPVTAAVAAREGLRVRVAELPPARAAHVQHEERRLEVLPGLDQLAADAAGRRRGLLQHLRGGLAAGVEPEAPPVGELRARVQAAKVERRRELPLEGHREEVRHRGAVYAIARRARAPDRSRSASARRPRHDSPSLNARATAASSVCGMKGFSTSSTPAASAPCAAMTSSE